ETPLDRDLAFEAAGDLSLMDFDRAAEQAGLGHFQAVAFLDAGLDRALDYEMVAGGNFTREGDVAADDQLADLAGRLLADRLGRAARRGTWSSAGGGDRRRA